MNQISDPPLQYEFGYDFNYSLWTQGTEVTMTNVAWNNDYRDIVDFPTRADLNAYIDGGEASNRTINGLSYVKPNEPVRIDIPFNVAQRYNYLRASNPLQPIAGDVTKDYYYFVTEVRYVAPNTTELILQLDVWQTFGFDVTFGRGYVERGHIGIANGHQFRNHGRDYLTVPEGLDVGGEYVNVARRTDRIFDKNTMDIMMVTTVSLKKPFGDANAPQLHSAEGSTIQGIPSGAEVYFFADWIQFQNFMFVMSDKPWVTQGIISVTMVPNLGRYGYSLKPVEVQGVSGVMEAGENLAYVDQGNYNFMFFDWRNSPELLDYIPVKYRHLRKFFTYPYMVIEMTTYTGAPIILKPEMWADNDANITEKISLIAPNQRVVIWPARYNAKEGSAIETANRGGPMFGGLANPTGSVQNFDDGGEYLDKATVISNFPTLPVVNNMAINYMASNSAGIAQSEKSADWAQNRALKSNQVSYDQQSAGVEMSKNINKMSNAGMGATVASDQLAMMQGVAANGLAGVVGGGMSGGLGGGMGGIQSQVMGGVNSGISQDHSNRNLATNQLVSQTNNKSQNTQAYLMRDTNKSLADFAAKGDYENNIAAINAKVQDAQMTQPSTSGQMGGDAFNIVNDAARINLKWKMIDLAAIRSIGDYWLRYGYAVNQFVEIPANLNVMEKFTYWKLSETYITSAPMPEYFKQAIRGIFEKGVTVWAKPEYIGNTDFGDNASLGGVFI